MRSREAIAPQRDVLMRRYVTFPRFQQQASAHGLTCEAIGIAAAFEHVMQELRRRSGDTGACLTVARFHSQ